jgi:flagellar protein FlgJ
VNRVWSHAVDAAQALGVQPQFMVGQAALETGWGWHEIRTADGQPSHNLFGIKAGKGWKGPTVEKTATVDVNGVATKVVNRFRVYASYSEGFRDYANLLRDNARYAGVIGQGDARGFARGLQRGGYATDSAYADKLVSVINSPPIRQAVAVEAKPQVLALR